MKNSLLWRRTSALAVVAIIFAGSSVPGKNIPEVFTLTPDKLIHCIEYFVLGFFLFRWLQLEFNTYSLIKISVITLIIGSIIGIADENYQRLTPGRSPDFWDWVLDSIGALLAAIITYYFAKRNLQKTT